MTRPLTATPSPIPRGGRIVELGLAGITTLNPLLAEDDLSRDVGRLLFDSLLRVNPQTAALLPGLAEDWQVADDGRTFTFHLRSGVAWHDGRPLSAADVAFTLSAAGDPDGPSPYRFDLAGVVEVTVPDDETVAVTLAEPGCDALYAVGRVPILPRHLLQGQELVGASFNEQPVGSGPFVLEAWQPGERLALTANEHYWAGRPYLDGWTYRVVPDAATLWEELRQGRAHLARLTGDLEAVSLPEGFQLLAYPADRWHVLIFNTTHPLLSDATVRQALALALDRERLLEVALDGRGALLNAPWPDAHWALDGAPPDAPGYDPERARQLLAETGWRDADGDGLLEKDGRRLQVSILTNLENPARERVAMLAQGYWHALGVAAQVEVLPWGSFLDDLLGHKFDVVAFDWPLEPGPDQSWLWAQAQSEPDIGFNFGSYASAEVDALLEQGRLAPGCDAARRAAAYRALAQRLAADQPYVFLFTAQRQVITSSSLIGLQPGPFAGFYWNVAEWHLREGK
ncbi:MAG: ABC transporter substrate-binding protein [Chloroflexota bacterium]